MHVPISHENILSHRLDQVYVHSLGATWTNMTAACEREWDLNGGGVKHFRDDYLSAVTQMATEVQDGAATDRLLESLKKAN